MQRRFDLFRYRIELYLNKCDPLFIQSLDGDPYLNFYEFDVDVWQITTIAQNTLFRHKMVGIVQYDNQIPKVEHLLLKKIE